MWQKFCEITKLSWNSRIFQAVFSNASTTQQVSLRRLASPALRRTPSLLFRYTGVYFQLFTLLCVTGLCSFLWSEGSHQHTADSKEKVTRVVILHVDKLRFFLLEPRCLSLHGALIFSPSFIFLMLKRVVKLVWFFRSHSLYLHTSLDSVEWEEFFL